MGDQLAGNASQKNALQAPQPSGADRGGVHLVALGELEQRIGGVALQISLRSLHAGRSQPVGRFAGKVPGLTRGLFVNFPHLGHDPFAADGDRSRSGPRAGGDDFGRLPLGKPR
jgi:hypothetical protein